MAREWRDAVGGAVMVAVQASPIPVYTLAVGDRSSVVVGIAFGFWELSTLLLLALVAPIVGKPRTDVLWAIAPYWGWIIAWRFGAGLARVARQRQVSESPSPAISA